MNDQRHEELIKFVEEKNCPVSPPKEHVSVPQQTSSSSNQAPVSEAKPGAPTVGQRGISGAEINDKQLNNSDGTNQENPQEEEETFDRKEAMRLVFQIYDSLQSNSKIERNLKGLKKLYDKSKEGQRISMKAIIKELKMAIEAVEGHLSLSEERNSTTSCIGDTIFPLLRLMAVSLKTSLSKEVIQQSNTLQNNKSTQRIEIIPLIGVLGSLFLGLYTLPAIRSKQTDNN